MAFGIFAIAMVLIYARPFGLPVWLSAVAGALCALAFGVVSAWDALRVLAMVWDSTLVLVGLIIIAMTFEKIGFFDSLASMFGVATLSSVGSAIINNLPMVMLGDLALKELGADSGLIYAHLLGCNIGSKLTPIGSLATLLWLASLRLHGVRIRILDYFKLSFIFSFGVLLAGVLGLWIGRNILNLG